MYLQNSSNTKSRPLSLWIYQTLEFLRLSLTKTEICVYAMWESKNNASPWIFYKWYFVRNVEFLLPNRDTIAWILSFCGFWGERHKRLHVKKETWICFLHKKKPESLIFSKGIKVMFQNEAVKASDILDIPGKVYTCTHKIHLKVYTYLLCTQQAYVKMKCGAFQSLKKKYLWQRIINGIVRQKKTIGEGMGYDGYLCVQQFT